MRIARIGYSAILLVGLVLATAGCSGHRAEEIERDVVRGLPSGAEIVAVVDIARFRNTFTSEQLQSIVDMNTLTSAVYERARAASGFEPLKDINTLAFAGYDMNGRLPTLVFLVAGRFDPAAAADSLKNVASGGNVEERRFSRVTYYVFVQNYRDWFVSFPSQVCALITNDEDYMKRGIALFRKSKDSVASDPDLAAAIGVSDRETALWIASVNRREQKGNVKSESAKVSGLGGVLQGVKTYAVSVDFTSGFEIKATLESASSVGASALKERLDAALERLRRTAPPEAPWLTWITRTVWITTSEQNVKLRITLSDEDLSKHTNDIEAIPCLRRQGSPVPKLLKNSHPDNTIGAGEKGTRTWRRK